MNKESAKHGICHVTGGMVLNINSGLSLLELSATTKERQILEMIKLDMRRLQEAIGYFDPKTKDAAVATNDSLKQLEGKQVEIEYVAKASASHPMFQKEQKATGVVEVWNGKIPVVTTGTKEKTILAYADEITKITIL